jgi:hypothetical protein
MSESLQIRIGLENGIEGRSLAWALDMPGCFAYGQDGAEALLRIPQAVITYREWIATHAATPWLQDLGDFDVALTEIFDCFRVKKDNKDYEVNAWFNDDQRVLSAIEVERGLAMLDWSKTELESLLQSLTLAQMEQKFPGERWNIKGVALHIAGANWWYLDRLGMANLDLTSASKAPMERIAQVQSLLHQAFATLVNKPQVVTVDEENWSPRKVLRRAIWHMRDHYFHIERLLTLL